MFILSPLVRCYRYFLHKKYKCPYPYIKNKFRKKLGYELDLENPQTFNEKMNWLKINQFDPLMTQCSDKYLVREYIREKLGEEYLIPLLYSTGDPADINPVNLPDIPCIVKQNHNSSGGIIIRNKEEINNWNMIRGTLRFGLGQNYYWHSREPQYRNITPRIVVEKLLFDEKGDIPSDYKLHYLNGELAFIQVDSDRQTAHKRTIYDPDWNHIPCAWEYPMGKIQEKPETLDKMTELGAILARDFTYVRADFYSLNGQVFFGELTFHADGGGGRFQPIEYDLKFGKMLQL
jgi:hypothetical protein